MAEQILDSPKVIVVTVGIGVYQKPKDEQIYRRAFPRLSGVAKDIGRLTTLMGSEAYQELGVHVIPSIRGTETTVRRKLKQVVEQVRAIQGCRLVVLWSGHAETIGTGDLRLATADSFTPMTAADGWTPEHLVDVLSAARAQGLYIVLDVCQAGQALGAVAEQAAKRMLDQPPSDGQPPGFAIICSAQSYENAKDGLFVGVLERVLREGPSADGQAVIKERGYGGVSYYNRLLTPRELSSVLEAEFTALQRRDPYIQRPAPASLGADFPIFLNPLWMPEAAPRRYDELGPYVSGTDAVLHFLPKARGLEPGDMGWEFTGRVEASRRISEFLAQAGDDTLLVVTGQAGVGKSAVIGRAVALTDATFRQNLEESTGWAEATARRQGTLPPIDGIDAALHLRGLGAAGMARQLADLLDLDVTGPTGAGPNVLVERLLTGAGAMDERPTIVLDALDEADEPRQIAESIILPLAELGCHVVVGTRRFASARGAQDLLKSLELPGAATYIDLSDDPASTDDIAAYVERRLASDVGPYARRGPLRRQIADAVSRRAGGRFLYAKLTADDLVKNPVTTLEALDDVLTSSVGAAFTRTLAKLDEEFSAEFGNLTRGATALAVGLAWSEGLGVPLRDRLWPRIATAAAYGSPLLTEEHCHWFLARAGEYVLESGDGHQAVYRLYHEALHEHLRSGADSSALRARIADALQEATQSGGGWPLANPYVVRYLVRYVDPSATDELVAVCTDPQYLSRAIDVLGVDGTARVLDRVRRHTPVPALVAVAKAVRRARVALARDPQQLAPQLIARLGAEHDPALLDLVQSANTIAPPIWLSPVNVRLDWSAELQTTQTLPGKVRAVAAGVLDAEPVLVLGAGESILLWDPRHGAVQGVIGNDGLRPTAVALGELDGQPVVASGSYEGSISVRNVRTGALVVPLIASGYVASLTMAAGPVTHLNGRLLPDEHVRSKMLDEQTAVYWSDRPGRLCTLENRLGVITVDQQGLRIVGDELPDGLSFTLGDGPRGNPPLLAVGSYFDQTILAVAEDDSTVRMVRPDGSPPLWVQVNFPIRCLAVTWVDGQPYVAAANDSDRDLGTASYVTIRQPTETSASSSRPALHVIGVGHWRDRLVAVLDTGAVHDVLGGVDLIGAAADAVELAAGISHPVQAGPGKPGSTQEWPVTATSFGRWDGSDVEIRGSYDGVIWVWDDNAGRFVAGPFTRRVPSEGKFHYAKGRELGAISALATGEIDGATWVVAADSRGLVIYDLATGHRLSAPSVGQSRIRALAFGFVTGRNLLATGSDGGALTIWEVGSWNRLTGFTMDDPVTGMWMSGPHLVVQTGALPLSCFELLGLGPG
jgi:hypothetical protein